jgi:hypothetical protein
MDIELVAVDLIVERLDLSSHFGMAIAKRVERKAHDAFAASAHRQEMRSELAKLVLEVSAAVGGTRSSHPPTMTRTGANEDTAFRSSALEERLNVDGARALQADATKTV